MIAFKYIPLVAKQAWRRRTRSLLTIAGVMLAMLLYCAIESMQRGVEAATKPSPQDTTLIVYRQNRYCPFSSRLPQHYESRIARIPGVESVVPMRVVVNNCRASLDVVTFRGLPPEDMADFGARFTMLAGGLEQWQARSDAALLGEAFASRRRLNVGDSFDAAGITVYVAGVFRSDEAQDKAVAYVHLPFLQQVGRAEGIVTQFNVRVASPDDLERVGKAIDAEFAGDSEPTYTSPEKAFVARAAADLVQLVSFTRYLGWACLAAVLALVGNAIVLSVQDRVKEHAVLRTLGYRAGLLARLVVAEGLMLSLIGGVLGSVAAVLLLRWANLTMSVEGVNLSAQADGAILALGVAISGVIGIVAGLIPGWLASKRQIAACFRAV